MRYNILLLVSGVVIPLVLVPLYFVKWSALNLLSTPKDQDPIRIVFQKSFHYGYAGPINSEVCGASVLPESAFCYMSNVNNIRGINIDRKDRPDAMVFSAKFVNKKTLARWMSKGIQVFFQLLESATRFPNVERLESSKAIAVTYRLHTAEIPDIYLKPRMVDYLLKHPVPKFNTTIRGLSFIASNSHSRSYREKYAKWFDRKYPTSSKANGTQFSFDSLGRFLRNTNWPEGFDPDPRPVIAKYMFYMAFENSCAYDYVSEKVYNGLQAGSLPVYYGAPNIEDFVPPNSVIDASKFKSLPELAAYLEKVSLNETLYNSYFEWRKDFDASTFLNHLQPFYKIPWYCRVCLYSYGVIRKGYNKDWWNKYLQIWQLPPDKNTFLSKMPDLPKTPVKSISSHKCVKLALS